MSSADEDRLSLLATAQIGDEPSSEYFERINAFDSVLRECMHLSHSSGGIRSPSSKHFYASVLFTALISRAASLAALLPFSPWAKKLIEHWDYASAMGVVRTMLEIRLAFFYLCVEECGNEEWSCRWNAFNLHDCMARKKLFEAMDDSKKATDFLEPAEELRERLRTNPYFHSLDKGLQKNVLNGKTAFLSPLERISERAGLSASQFRWIYIFFSSHVHGLPMSFYRMGHDFEDRGRGVYSEVEENYTKLSVSLAVSLLIKSRDEFRAMFEGLKTTEGALKL